MTNDPIYELMKQIWKKPKVGFHWINAHFYKDAAQTTDREDMKWIVTCLISKRDGTECIVHRRMHKMSRVISISNHLLDLRGYSSAV